jgi:hypothetical protein
MECIPLTGHHPLADASKSKYVGNLRMLNHFFTMIGDYESMLILQEDSPDNCISMNIDSIILFACYKCGEKGTLLKDLNGNIKHDVDGKPMKCTGDWKDPNNVDGLHSAVHLLHDSQDHCGQYEDHCPRCLSLDESEQYKGCQSHAKNPRLIHWGNPVLCNKWKECVLASDKDGKDYKAHGCDQLLPSDLRHLQTYLLACNSLAALQMLVIIFLAV